MVARSYCGLHIHFKFHWPKLHFIEGTLVLTEFSVGFTNHVPLKLLTWYVKSLISLCLWGLYLMSGNMQ